MGSHLVNIFVSITIFTLSHFMVLIQPQTVDTTTYNNKINRRLLNTPFLSRQVMTCVWTVQFFPRMQTTVNIVRSLVKPPAVHSSASHHAHSSDKVSFFTLSRMSQEGDDMFLSDGVKICWNVTKHTVSSLASFTVRTLFNKSSQCVLRLRIEEAIPICRG
jgi:hypothetical protein